MNDQSDAPVLSVIIPLYNEVYTIEQIIDRVLNAPLDASITKELIIVDDCSTDGTRDKLKTLSADRPDITIIFHEKNCGKGAAVRTGITKTRGDIVLIQDADLEYSPDDYPKLLKPILNGDADVVYGSRFASSDYRRVLYFWHAVGNKFLTLLSNLMTNLNLTDMETCFKVVRGDILRSIPIRSHRFGIEPELTAKFAKRRCRIYEVPISYRGRSYQEGKKTSWKDGVSALYTIFKYWLIDDVYNEQYGHDILHSLSKTHRFNRWMADAVSPFVGEQVLEIGAGMGNLTQQFLPRESYTTGDIDELHLNYMRNVYKENPRVHVREINVEKAEDFEGLDNSFDTVIALNVIEHVEHDDWAFENIYKALIPGGKACILVPRGPGLYGSLDEVLGHYRRYTPEMLQERMEAAGFVIKKRFTFNSITLPAWWFNAKIMKSKRFNKFQLKVFDSMVWFWRRVDRFIPWPGVSVIAIGEKPAAPSSDSA